MPVDKNDSEKIMFVKISFNKIEFRKIVLCLNIII